MANVVLTVLSLTIGFFFILVGTLKLTPSLNEEVYREMLKSGVIDNSEVEDCPGTELQREDCCLFASAQENDNSTVRQIYQLQRKTFIRDTKVFPLVNQTGWKPNPHTFRKVVGTTEVVAGSVLAIVPGPLKEVANVILLTEMLGAVYTHYMLNDSMDKITPALVFGLLLGCRLIVYMQVKNRDLRQQSEQRSERQATVGKDEKKKQ